MLRLCVPFTELKMITDPANFYATLDIKILKIFSLQAQIKRTLGYEEAASQGILIIRMNSAMNILGKELCSDKK